MENFGQYFGPNGPAVTIEGLAVPVNAYNTRLNVGFGGLFGPAQPSAEEPGNYWIIDYAPDYSWAIVSDPDGTSGFILTRDQFIAEAEYNAAGGPGVPAGCEAADHPDPAVPGRLPHRGAAGAGGTSDQRVGVGNA